MIRFIRQPRAAGLGVAVALCALLGGTAHSQGINPIYQMVGNQANTLCTPTVGTDGYLYVPVTGGGPSYTQVLKMTLGGTIVADFMPWNGNNGFIIPAAMIQANDGNFYGVTEDGGDNGLGTVFQLTPSGSMTIIYSFTGGQEGDDPKCSLIQANDGNLYGVTFQDPADDALAQADDFNFGGGAIFEITPGPSGFTPVGTGGTTLSVLYNFTNNWTYGPAYTAALVQGADGYIYGVQQSGNGQTTGPFASTYGFVYRFSPGGSNYTVVQAFDWYNGANPQSIMSASDGNIYGTDNAFDPTGSGIIWEYQPATNTFQLLPSALPVWLSGPFVTTLVEKGDGYLYGTYNDATTMTARIYKMPLGGGTISVLDSFTGGADGAYPYEGMTLAPNGYFYGTTQLGGVGGSWDSGNGVVWTTAPMTPPTITISGLSSTSYVVGTSVTVTYSASDPDVAITSVTGTLPSGSTIPMSTPGIYSFIVTATDAAGGTSTKTIQYRVVYGSCMISLGFCNTLVAAVELTDSRGHDVSSSSVPVTATGITTTGGSHVGSIASGAFSFVELPIIGRFYYLDTKVSGLSKGQYVLHYSAGSDPSDHTASFTVL